MQEPRRHWLYCGDGLVSQRLCELSCLCAKYLTNALKGKGFIWLLVPWMALGGVVTSSPEIERCRFGSAQLLSPLKMHLSTATELVKTLSPKHQRAIWIQVVNANHHTTLDAHGGHPPPSI